MILVGPLDFEFKVNKIKVYHEFLWEKKYVGTIFGNMEQFIILKLLMRYLNISFFLYESVRKRFKVSSSWIAFILVWPIIWNNLILYPCFDLYFLFLAKIGPYFFTYFLFCLDLQVRCLYLKSTMGKPQRIFWRESFFFTAAVFLCMR